MTFTYKLQKSSESTEPDSVTKFFTGTNMALSIPFDPDNADYQEYLEWAKTNTADPAD
tara:strand:- start:1278 stop:1451 length:174 start_codon:yes stop_codon:yes gene_type:complete